MSPLSFTGGVDNLLVFTAPSAYGLTSKLRSFDGTSVPSSRPALDSLFRPRRPHETGTGDRYEISFFHRTIRRTLIPHAGPPSANRIERKGVRKSTVQPPSTYAVPPFQPPPKSAVPASHRLFQFGLRCSLVVCQSNRPPCALDENPNPFR